MKDHPEVGVCKWAEWSRDAACYLLDPKCGHYPEVLGLDYRRALRMVRQQPLRTNPWRRCFARYSMTPWEAKQTLFGDDPDSDARFLSWSNGPSNGGTDGGGRPVKPKPLVLA